MVTVLMHWGWGKAHKAQSSVSQDSLGLHGNPLLWGSEISPPLIQKLSSSLSVVGGGTNVAQQMADCFESFTIKIPVFSRRQWPNRKLGQLSRHPALLCAGYILFKAGYTCDKWGSGTDESLGYGKRNAPQDVLQANSDLCLPGAKPELIYLSLIQGFFLGVPLIDVKVALSWLPQITAQIP